jgi:hypothetical protein
MTDELLGWPCAGPLIVLVLIQCLGGLICWRVLRRASPPFLWSLDWADVLLRLEREFGITFCPGDFRNLERQPFPDITAGELLAVVYRKIWDTGHPAPADSWQRLAGALGEALNVSPPSIMCETRLCADLGMEYVLL